MGEDRIIGSDGEQYEVRETSSWAFTNRPRNPHARRHQQQQLLRDEVAAETLEEAVR